MKSIKRSGIGEGIIYNWECHECGENNRTYEDPFCIDKYICKSCGHYIELVD